MKAAGVLLCISAGFLIGNYFSENIKKRYMALNNIRRMILQIIGEIEYTRSNISDIFYKLSKKQESPYREFMEYIHSETEGTNGRLKDIWKRGVDGYFSQLKLTDKDLEMLEKLGNSMGSIGIRVEIENLELYIKEVDELLLNIREELANKTKLYRMLGLFGGMAIAIILI